MDTLTLVLIAAVAVLGLLVLWLLVRHGFGGPTRAPDPTWKQPVEGSGRVVVLDLVVEDPGRASLQRLVHDVGARVLAGDPDLDTVEVRDRTGTTLGHVTRPDPLPPSIATTREASGPRPHRPSPTGGSTPPPVDHQGSGVDLKIPTRTFADRFELPDAVRSHLTDPESPVALLRAILQAAGRSTHLDGEVLVADDTGVVVALVHGDPNAALNHAYLRFRDTGLPRGLVVHIGFVDPEYVRHREAAAPNVRHVGVDAVQRMADAVDLGSDPLSAALGPPVLR